MKVTNTDLLNNRYKYSIDILEQNIVENHLDAKILLATQNLTPEFCVKYILDLDIEYQHFNRLKPAFYKLITTIPI